MNTYPYYASVCQTPGVSRMARALSGCFHKNMMQEPRIPGTLADVMRTPLVIVGAGDGGPSKLDRQSLSLCLSAAVDREASTSLLAKGNKKAQSHHTPIAMGYG